MTARPTKPPVRFVLPEGAPGLVRAAALALAIARHCKAASWLEFVERVHARDDATLALLAGVEVDPADSHLVHAHDHVLRLLSVRPLVTVAVCPECDGWVLTAGTPPTKCRVTGRCTGKPMKASLAAKAKPPTAEPADEPEPTIDLDSDPELRVDVKVTVTAGN